MKESKIFLLLVLINFTSSLIHGQGCSDAGFCTINSFKPGNSDTVLAQRNQIKAGLSFGSADHSVSVFGMYLEYNKQINNNLGLDVKLTGLSQSGNDISVSGFSDIYLNVNYAMNKNVKLTLGSKIPLADGNKKKDNLALPMDYQSSLGTFDLIFGLGFEISSFQLVAAFQQPLSQNENEFLSESYPVNSELSGFQSTNNFSRSGDVLLRLSRPVSAGNKLIITPSLLPIYHLSNDKFIDVSGIEKEIDGSKGLTFNVNIFLDFEINHKNAIQLNAGLPLIVRDARPDGLTRHYIVNFEYRIKL